MNTTIITPAENFQYEISEMVEMDGWCQPLNYMYFETNQQYPTINANPNSALNSK